jgi:HPr kinase/phosphorylase
MSSDTPTIHASAVLVGARALLIRGPSGSGKSQLAFALLQAAQSGVLGFARLVADDRAIVASMHGRLLVRPAPALIGMIEVRGLGVRHVPYEPLAVVGAVVDLAAEDGSRLPDAAGCVTDIAGVRVPRLAVAAGADARPLVLAYLQTADAIP